MCPKYGQNTIAIPKTARAKARGQQYLKHQTLGRRFICPIVPATQCNILEIDGFQMSKGFNTEVQYSSALFFSISRSGSIEPMKMY